MRADLTVPYADTAHDQLTFALDEPLLPALSTRELADVAGPGVHLSLRLLGASHQAVLRTPDGELTETLACLAGRSPHLPREVDERVAGVRYRFAVSVDALSENDFSDAIAGVRREVEPSPYGLVGVFPGHDEAVTALLVEPGGGRVAWRTWHAYPQTRHLVATRTTALVTTPLVTTARRDTGRTPR